MTRDDDDAITWEGDEPSREPALPTGFSAVGRGAETVGERHDDGTATRPGERPSTSNALLVAYGVLGGVHLLFAVGWLLAGLRLAPLSAFLVTPAGGSTPPLWEAGALFAVALAVAAPLLWFAATLALTRTAPAWTRVVALVAGAALLVPWPFVVVGAGGA